MRTTLHRYITWLLFEEPGYKAGVIDMQKLLLRSMELTKIGFL